MARPRSPRENNSAVPIETSFLLKAPTDPILDIVGAFLNPQELQELSLTNKNFHQLFQPQLKVNRLLLHVARGEQQEAEEFLKKNIQVLLAKGQVSDYAGRFFGNITAFQLALWNLDRHMWNMLLQYLSLQDAAKQLQEHQDAHKQPDYVKAHGRHYDFSPLITALQAYIDYLAHQNFTVSVADNLWSQVGSAQRDLPAHALHEYCREDRAFCPTPTFKEEQLPRTLKFHQGAFQLLPTLFDHRINLFLGVDFSLFRGRHRVRAVGGIENTTAIGRVVARNLLFAVPGAIEWDLIAITALSEVRAQEFAELRERLLHPEPDRIAVTQRNKA